MCSYPDEQCTRHWYVNYYDDDNADSTTTATVTTSKTPAKTQRRFCWQRFNRFVLLLRQNTADSAQLYRWMAGYNDLLVHLHHRRETTR